MVNVTYFVQSIVFGRHWSLYLLGNYVIEGAVVATSWLLARVCFGLRERLALLVTLACALSPAYNYLVVFRPSFAFDLLRPDLRRLGVQQPARRQGELLERQCHAGEQPARRLRAADAVLAAPVPLDRSLAVGAVRDLHKRICLFCSTCCLCWRGFASSEAAPGAQTAERHSLPGAAGLHCPAT